MPNRIKYSTNLNGLRALAIFGVIGYHFNSDLVKGGWLGVNLFFVLSGYLIGNILLSFDHFNLSNFLNFIKKRIFRIVPTLVTVAALTFPFAIYFLRPASLVEYSKTLLSSQFFLSNFYFYTLDSYTADLAKFRPLLHTWSLSLEFQFYLFTACAFLFFRKKIIIFLLLVLASSFILNISQDDSMKLFYLPQYRIFEFVLGVMINFQKLKFISKFNIQNNLLEYIYFSVILVSFFTIEDSKTGNLSSSLPVVLSTFFLISKYINYQSNNLFEWKIFQLIGKMSYSLYVVHFPVIAFFNIYKSQFNVTPSLKLFILQISVIFVFSYFIHKVIEQRFMVFSNLLRYRLKLFLLFSGLFILSISGILRSDSFLSFKNLPVNFQQVLIQGSRVSEISCWNKNLGCYVDNNSDTTVYFVGDSQLASPYLEFVNSPKSKNFNWFVWIKPRGVDPINLMNAENSLSNIFVDTFLNDNSKKIVVYGGRFPHYLKNTQFFNGEVYSVFENSQVIDAEIIEKNMKFLSLNSNQFIVLGPIPEQAWDVTNLVFNNIEIAKDLSYPAIYWSDYSKDFTNLLSSLNLNNLYFVDSESIFCQNLLPNRCVAALDTNFYYYDSLHLSQFGGALISDKIIAIIYD